MIMERKTWNQLKREILELLKGRVNITSRDVAMALNCDVHNSAMCLYRLFRQRLVTREPMPIGIWRKPPYQYNVTSRGLARLEYYEGLMK